jgi:superfamily II DNA or RNA helicase
MTVTRLQDHTYRIAYGPSDDRVNDFYVPALSASVRYDRSAGFFSSSALAVAAAGVARLIQNGGRMRLLVGAQLSEQDVQALHGGEDLAAVVGRRMETDLTDLADIIARERLAALAWMVKGGTLELKVVLPTGKDGQPLPAALTRDYFHPKMGIFTDAQGDQLAFSGSVNESAQAWVHNYEMFDVYVSWNTNLKPFITQKTGYFERLWQGQEADWIALPVPAAVKQKLIRYAPDQAPTRDPLERREPEPEPPRPGILTEAVRERIIFQFLRDAPHLPNADKLGQAVITIHPWPHQVKVADKMTAGYPNRYLLCDEVGLGKTIEAGLILKQLTLSGKVNRALILAPHSICRQWQEELYEKFLMNIPLYDGGRYTDYFGRELPTSAENPWNGFPLMIASSQLAKRKDRQPELHEAEPWDLLLVDEAHHARRKDFISGAYRPNSLLTLLLGSNDNARLSGIARPEKARGLILMTATPMQVHPVEVWDLLNVLGVGGKWGASQERFLTFFEELRKPDFDDINWPFVLSMVRDHLDQGGEIDTVFAEYAERKVGAVTWEQIRSLPYSDKVYSSIGQLDSTGRAVLKEFVRRHTPLSSHIFRNTRSLLRKYQEKGFLGNDKVPHRKPKNEWISMTVEERELYERIEEYISDFYKKYEAERKGLGFIMTVYRRRLTSSFYAIRESLKRRLSFLKGDPTTDILGGLTEEDYEQEDLSNDVTDDLMAGQRELFKEEIAYVTDFLAALKLIDTDSKVERLIQDLNDLLQRRETALVFTLYTDTMDFLREKLRQVYGSQVACYSGRGGEVWDGHGWRITTKEAVKNDFKDEKIKILLCTESASEGLNLQTCGILINFDMAWNPMRIEQRIGRIDRIGQRYDDVWIRNYFYEDTVEAKVYQALEGRIQWFENVVGELQPILARVAQIIQSAALERGAHRAALLEREIEAIRREIDQQQVSALNLDDYLADEVAAPTAQDVPVTARQIQDQLLGSKTLRRHFQPHGEIPNAYQLRLDDEIYGVTFDGGLFDQYPDSLRLLSYQEELFTKLLDEIPAPGEGDLPPHVIRLASNEPPLVGYYLAAGEDAAPVHSLAELLTALDRNPGTPSEALRTAAQDMLAGEIEKRRANQAQAEARMKGNAISVMKERARQLLTQAGFLEMILESPDLFTDPQTVMSGFTAESIQALRKKGFPYAPMMLCVSTDDLSLSPTDPFYLKVKDDSPAQIKKRLEAVKSQIGELIEPIMKSQ